MAASSWPLNESELDYLAETRGWDKVEGLLHTQPSMASYTKYGMRLNFWLSTGTIGSYLDHPHQGKMQLFRRQIFMPQVSEIFQNPRQHTGIGYHTTNENKDNSRNGYSSRKQEAEMAPPMAMRTCARCSKSKSKDQFSNNQHRKGASPKCKSCVA